MFDIDPSEDGGWLVAAAAFVLNIVTFGFGRGEKARDHRRAEINAEIDKRFAGTEGFESRLVRIETTVDAVQQGMGRLDRKLDVLLVGGRFDDEEPQS